MAWFLELTKKSTKEKEIYNADSISGFAVVNGRTFVYFNDKNSMYTHLEIEESYEDVRKLLGVDFVGMEEKLHSEWWEKNFLKDSSEKEVLEEETNLGKEKEEEEQKDE